MAANRPRKPIWNMPSRMVSPSWENFPVRMMPPAYRHASSRHRASPRPNPAKPPFSARKPTPASVTAAHSSVR